MYLFLVKKVILINTALKIELNNKIQQAGTNIDRLRGHMD